MTSQAAIRHVVANAGSRSSASRKGVQANIYLTCHVKPGAASKREGVVAVTESQIEVCVAAQARDGEANKAVRELISTVLGVPKSSVDISKGHKSRDKTIVVSGLHVGGPGASADAEIAADILVQRIRLKLEDAATTG
ncbi:MAG: hypothetical protein M1825_000621 [Sarcosagium campestre]|nr:MAG: hypothetical protein M1825_000621 [Sarcosagium campestre]